MTDLELSSVELLSLSDMTHLQWAVMNLHIVVRDTKLNAEARTVVHVPIAYAEADTMQALRERAYRRAIECVRFAIPRMEEQPTPPVKKKREAVYPDLAGPEAFDLQFRVARFLLFEDMKASGWAKVCLEALLYDRKLETDFTIYAQIPVAYDKTDTTHAVRKRAYRRAIECFRVALPALNNLPPPRLKKPFGSAV